MGRLTTHVLDIAHGRPAGGLRIELVSLEAGGAARPVKVVTTNADGRTDEPLLEGSDLTAGMYELRFHAGDHFRRLGVALPDPAFVDVVPVRFGIADPDSHYHVPLLVGPWSYSTYRGS
jgi:5-hydroxyisourate hydrolase